MRPKWRIEVRADPKPLERAKRGRHERIVGFIFVLMCFLLGAMMPPSVEGFLGLDAGQQDEYDAINAWIASAASTASEPDLARWR